ncbi:MAG TPA: hypothetical protein VGJ29_16000 [Vicinamibacterales bacterium]|jgi:hypothetical protein
MDRTASLAELLNHESEIEPHEAVAIVQQLIRPEVDRGEHPVDFTDPSPGPLSTDRVRLEADGSAVCVGSDATPAVSEAANLLQRILPHGGSQVPGGLRYTIARALLDVEAPPFDSLEDFSRALARFERGDRREVVQRLLERSAHASGVAGLSRRPVPLHSARVGEGVAGDVDPAPPSPSDRRVPTVTVTELRRQLREADQRLFVQRSAAQPRIEMRSTHRLGRRVPAIAAGVFVGLSLIGAGEAMRFRRASEPAAVSSGAPAAAPASTVSEPAWQATVPPDPPKPIDRPQPRTPRPPTAVAHRHASKSARAVATGSSPARTRDRGRQTDSAGIFNRIKFKWVDDLSPRRE